ncbi:MAG: polysaccharide deacetylase family protein [Christensenellales bacterium]|jgi:hypothetical protein
MKRIFLTLDFEEWTTVEYLQKYRFRDEPSFCALLEFLPDALAERNIPATVFAVGDAAKAHKEVLRKFADIGCPIGLHSMHHERPKTMDAEAFRRDVREGKALLEDIVGKPVTGYRAPCFSMDLDKTDVLWEEGFTYDSSYIALARKDLYAPFDLSSFTKCDSAIYEKNGRYEFEIPTLHLGGRHIPIAGGGYFRLFPPFLTEALYAKYSKQEDTFLLYLHPYEFVDDAVPQLAACSFKDRMRFQIGRKGNREKLFRFVTRRRNEGVRFMTMPEYIAERYCASGTR